MIRIGITGGYATGKTVVANMFAGQGAEVICADKIVHMVMQPYTAVWEKIIKVFSKKILKKNNNIDRRKLAKIVFTDKKKLVKLNRLVHPSVKMELKRIIQDRESKKKTKILALEIPLLFEAGMEDWFDKIVVVACNEDVQYKRAKRRDGVHKIELSQRIKNQWSLGKKEKRADFVVDNNGSRADTRRQVAEIWKILETADLTD